MAGRIPKQFIDEVLIRADIVELIDAHVPLKKAGKDYKACCPFHDEKTPSFTVSPTKQFYHCFGCGAHGTALGFLMEYERMSFPEAVEELARRAGLALPMEGFEPTQRSDTAPLLRVLEEAARYYRSQLREHPRAIDYLKGRGISGEIAAAFGLGYAPDGWDHLTRRLGTGPAEREALVQSGLAARKESGGCYDRFRGRIMFPIHDYRGRIVAFGGRLIDAAQEGGNPASGDTGTPEAAKGPKYLNSPETPLFHKGRELYGLFRARDVIRAAGRVLVVEGYMDVVALAQFGVGNAVATLGTATTGEHLERLFRYVPDGEVVFCFDGDRAGEEAAWRALDIVLPTLHEHRRVSFMFLPAGEDPDSLARSRGKDGFLAEVAAARSVPDFLFQGLARKVDLRRSDGPLRLAELAKPYLDKVPAGLLREAMLDRLPVSPVLHRELAAAPKVQRGPAPVPAGRARLREPRQPSIVWMAAALLVQHPELGRYIVDRSLLDELDRPGMPLFRAVTDAIKENPRLNTAGIVEYFRDSEHQHHIGRLAAWSHSALTADVAAEFQGVLLQLRRTAIRQKVQNLLHKQQISGLNPAEKKELASLNRLQVEKPETAQP